MSELNESLNNSHSHLIKSVFSDLENLPSSKLSYDDLSRYLSKKSGKTFSNELLLEIFHSINLTQSSKISADEFISGYQKTEHMITSQISSLKQQITENISSLSKAQKNLLEAKSAKFSNKTDNNLYMTINKVQGLEEVTIRGKWVVRIGCDGNEVLTDPKEKWDLEWGQSFTFPVSTGQGSVQVQVCNWDLGRVKDSVAEVSIPFCALAKQELHEDTLNMKVGSGVKGEVRIDLAVQWIYDLAVYLEGMIKQYEDAIKEDKNQLEILKNFLIELKSPAETFALPGWVKNSEELGKLEKIVSSTVQEVFEKVEFFQSSESEHGVLWSRVLKITFALFFMLTVFNSFLRPEFFNVSFR